MIFLENETVEFDLSKWTFLDFVDFTQRADNNKVLEIIEKAISSCSLGASVKMNELGMVESVAILHALRTHLNTYLETLDYSNIRVSFRNAKYEGKAWTFDTHTEFSSLVAKRDFEKWQDMLSVLVPDYEPQEPLMFEYAAKHMLAVQDAYKELLAGNF